MTTRLGNRAKRYGLALAALGTIAAALAVGEADSGIAVVGPVKPRAAPVASASRPVRAAPVGTTTLEGVMPRRFDDEPTELFHVPPPPPPPVPAKAVAEKPVAPPLAIKFLGRMLQDGTEIVLLSHNGQDIVARTGEQIGSVYRIEEIAAASIRFTYLPLNTTQTLTIGDGS